MIRRTNILMTTERRLTVRPLPTAEQIICGQCCEMMILVPRLADSIGLSSRLIYRLIESAEVHFVESPTYEMYVCPLSLREKI